MQRLGGIVRQTRWGLWTGRVFMDMRAAVRLWRWIRVGWSIDPANGNSAAGAVESELTTIMSAMGGIYIGNVQVPVVRWVSLVEAHMAAITATHQTTLRNVHVDMDLNQSRLAIPLKRQCVVPCVLLALR
jgi:hypothetical protein